MTSTANLHMRVHCSTAKEPEKHARPRTSIPSQKFSPFLLQPVLISYTISRKSCEHTLRIYLTLLLILLRRKMNRVVFKREINENNLLNVSEKGKVINLGHACEIHLSVHRAHRLFLFNTGWNLDGSCIRYLSHIRHQTLALFTTFVNGLLQIIETKQQHERMLV